MSKNRKIAVTTLAVWVLLIIAASVWAMSGTYSTFYADAVQNGLSGIEAFGYALKLSAAAATWIKIPLIFGNVAVGLAFAHLWKKN